MWLSLLHRCEEGRLQFLLPKENLDKNAAGLWLIWRLQQEETVDIKELER
ncbi:MAG: hypothetical protein R2784_02110 [Saprospiraceae bacterium]